MFSRFICTSSFAFFILCINSVVAQDGCAADCHLIPNALLIDIDWQTWPYFSSTILGITFVEIVNTDLGTTRTSTIFDESISISETNADGTRTSLVTYQKGSEFLTTELAFPTPFQVVPQTWDWYGTLSTTGSDGQSSCMTVAQEAPITFSLDYFPPQPTSFSLPPGAENDPRGWNFSPSTHIVAYQTSLASAIPGEPAFSSCLLQQPAPVIASAVVSYLATTSTSFEGGSTPSPTASSRSQASPLSPTSTVRQTGSLDHAGVSTRVVVSEGSAGPVTAIITMSASTSATKNGGMTLSVPLFLPNLMVILLIGLLVY